MTMLESVPQVRRIRRRLSASNGLVAAAATLLGLVVVAATFAPVFAPYSPYATSLSDALLPPGSPGHLLGTDSTGRDTLSRLIYGARLSLLAPLGVVLISTVAGVTLGLVAARRGGWLDVLVGRGMDIVLAFPSLLLALIAVAIFGAGLIAPVIALAIAYTPFIGRVVRSAALQELARPYVGSYEVMGFSGTYITIRRVLPNLLPLILAQAALAFGYALIDIAALSYLGLGVQPPEADWGTMINQSQGDIILGSPWSAIIPGIAIVLTVVSMNIVGERLAVAVSGRQVGR